MDAHISEVEAVDAELKLECRKEKDDEATKEDKKEGDIPCGMPRDKVCRFL